MPNHVGVLVLLAFPYLGPGRLVLWLLGGSRPDDLWVFGVLSAIAVGETVLAIAWLLRPKRPSGHREP